MLVTFKQNRNDIINYTLKPQGKHLGAFPLCVLLAHVPIVVHVTVHNPILVVNKYQLRIKVQK